MSYRDITQDHSGCLTKKEAYLAMYYFIKDYWVRGGRRDGSVTLLLHAVGPEPDPADAESLLTADPAFWDDWQVAIGCMKNEGMPKEL